MANITQNRTGDQSATAYSARYQQSYHSEFGALTESREVYLQASAVADRLTAGHPTRVLEIGFGLGLNCLVTRDCAENCQTPLHYHSIEHDLVNSDSLRSLNYGQWLKSPRLANQLAAVVQSLSGECVSECAGTGTPSTTPSIPNLDTDQVIGTAGLPCCQVDQISQFTKHCTVEISVADASALQFCSCHYDAVYLDAFSPNVNAECWTPAMFGKLFDALVPGGLLVSYCVKGDVRRGLQAVGFQVEKRPGPPGKRETLVARKS